MKILLTGGTGFFGRAFLDYLSEYLPSISPVSVTVIARKPREFLKAHPRFADRPWLSITCANILHSDSLPRGQEFTHVLHAATEASLSSSIDFKRQYFEIIDGARNLLDLSVSSGAKRFLLISSGAVYGPQPPDVDQLREDWHGSPALDDPTNAYGLGKRAAEHMCTLYSHSCGLDYSIARCFSFIGPSLPLNAHYAIGNFINDAINDRDITIRGNGLPLRSYLDQKDLSHWLFTLLLHGRNGNAYNVGSDQPISLLKVAEMTRDLLAPHRSIKKLGQAGTAPLRSTYVPDISKARRDLGLSVKVPLSDAILMAATPHLEGRVV